MGSRSAGMWARESGNARRSLPTRSVAVLGGNVIKDHGLHHSVSNPMDKVAFGVLLRQARLAAGLTREQLSGSSGVSVRAINYIESGRTRKPYPWTVQVLADALSLQGAAR